MKMTKKYDAVVKTGSYTDRTGATKNRYKNVGIVMENDKGELSLLLDATFNPAGVPRDAGRESIFISFYPPKDRQNETSPNNYAAASGGEFSAQELDDTVPF